MKVKMYEDYENRHGGRMSKYAQIGGQRDKEKFVRGLVKLAEFTSQYVDRAHRLMDTFQQLYEDNYIEEDHIDVDGSLPYSNLLLEIETYPQYEVFLMFNRLSLSMLGDADHFFWLAHDGAGNPFECDLSTNYDDMLNYTNSYGWDNMSEADKKQFIEWITQESNEAETTINELLGKMENELEELYGDNLF